MQHANLASGGWLTLTLAEQMGNIGSEFARAVNWKLQDKQKFQDAQMRFFELMDLTLSDPRWRGPRRRELARAREEAARELEESQTHLALQRYFDQFAFLARAER